MVLVLACGSLQCQRSQKKHAEVIASAIPRSASAAPGVVPSGKSLSQDPEAPQLKREPDPVSAGEAVESDVYDLTLLQFKRCSSPDQPGVTSGNGSAPKPGASATTTAPTSAATSATADSPTAKPTVFPHALLGAEIAITAKTKKLFVSHGDAMLRSGGFRFNATLPPEDVPKDCGPLLHPTNLSMGQTVRGFVLFELPTARAKDLTFYYKPTRWSGAGQVLVRVPDLSDLDADPDTEQGRTKARVGEAP